MIELESQQQVESFRKYDEEIQLVKQDYEEKINKMNKKMAKLQQQVKDHNLYKTVIENKIIKYTKDIELLRKDYDKVKAEKDKLLVQTKKLTKKQVDLTKETRVSQKQSTDLAETVKSLTSELNILRQQNNHKSDKENEYQNTINQLQTLLNSTRLQHQEDLKKSAESISSLKASFKDGQKAIQADLDSKVLMIYILF